MRRTIVFAVAVLAALAFHAASAKADSITLVSAAAGVYDYEFQVTSSSVTWAENQSVVFSGLSGVTGASATELLAGAFTVTSLTSDSVTFSETGFPAAVFSGSPFFFLRSILLSRRSVR